MKRTSQILLVFAFLIAPLSMGLILGSGIQHFICASRTLGIP